MGPTMFEKDAAKKEEMLKKIFSEQVIPHVQIIEKDLAKNSSGYLVGSKITWADLAYFTFFAPIVEKNPDIVKDAPHLKKLLDRIENIPQIKNWISVRPQTAI